MANKEYSDLSAKYEVALVTIDRLEADISGIAGRVETIEGWRDSLSAVFQKYRQLIKDRLHEDYFEQQSNNYTHPTRKNNYGNTDKWKIHRTVPGEDSRAKRIAC